MKIKLTWLAEADLEDIKNYTIENWDFSQAERYITILNKPIKHCKLILLHCLAKSEMIYSKTVELIKLRSILLFTL